MNTSTLQFMFYFSTYSANLFLFDFPESSPGQCNSRLGSMHYHWSKRWWQWIECFCSGAINGPHSNWNKLWWSVFVFFFLHSSTQIIIMKVTERKEKLFLKNIECLEHIWRLHESYLFYWLLESKQNFYRRITVICKLKFNLH